jgi:outer membrane protein assembly factor BamB
MELQWFGRPGPREMIDRHHRNVPPLYKDGRVYVPGDCVVFAVDAYNGTILWEARVPSSRRLGVFLDSSNLVVDDEYLYVVAEDKCHGFDVQTGEQRLVQVMPQLGDGEPRHWGYLAYVDDLLFGSGRKPGASYTATSYQADLQLWYQGVKLVSSEYVFGMDRETGEVAWTYQSGLIVNTTITIGGGRMYFVETSSPAALANDTGRVPLLTMFDGGEQYLVALDMHDGHLIYKREIDTSELQQVCYLAHAKDLLLLSGSQERNDRVLYHYYAFDADTGEQRWTANHDANLPSDGGHGEYNRHPTIIEETVYAWPYAYQLKTGERVEDWRFDRLGHGCGGISASVHSLFWRGKNPWTYDLTPGGGPQRLTNITRPGCWINMIPAGGLLLVPEASSGCTCPFSIQASMAFRPGLPTSSALAPGDRRDPPNRQ